MRAGRSSWIRLVVCAAVAAALALPMGASTAVAKDKDVLVLSCFGVQMTQGRTGMLNINIERWSDDAEAETLKTVLVEKDEDALLRALKKLPRAGSMRFSTGGVGWEIRFARHFPLPNGGQAIFIATDRHIGYREAATSGRSMDYAFTLAEIHLDKKGGTEGQGKLAGMAKVPTTPRRRTSRSRTTDKSRSA